MCFPIDGQAVGGPVQVEVEVEVELGKESWGSGKYVCTRQGGKRPYLYIEIIKRSGKRSI